ncbi:hypothetical protein N7517_001167 [Penicillium concentricum]|uniref:BZIP domain-containing protein n=1 Tax=Penicillium concentricum TaxID=293559 RepID=A0A9W9SRP3_9EURO|nr:uncharacterized protein N7517_001167 [Penicillium concentricum]KAJ5383256.1 hypothetical protein N7517_001167 [Penicillium concentricum]
MDSYEFPDIPDLEYPQIPRASSTRIPLHSSKADQQRERNRQAQRRHRQSIKQRLEKYDRLRESLQDPENDPKDSEDFANLPSNQQQNLPSPSTSRTPSVPTSSILSRPLSEVDVDQPKNAQPADPYDTLSQSSRAWSTAQDINSSPGSLQSEKHSLMTFSPSDAAFELDPSSVFSQLEFETKIKADSQWGSGRTLLHQGVVLNSEDIVLVLLAHVADMEARDYDGRTPLHLAAALGYVSIGRLLLMHGAATTVSWPDKCGLTPMHLAVQNGHAPMVEALVEFGAGVNLRF